MAKALPMVIEWNRHCRKAPFAAKSGWGQQLLALFFASFSATITAVLVVPAARWFEAQAGRSAPSRRCRGLLRQSSTRTRHAQAPSLCPF